MAAKKRKPSRSPNRGSGRGGSSGGGVRKPSGNKGSAGNTSRAGTNGKTAAGHGTGGVRQKDPIAVEITGVIIIAVSIFFILSIYAPDKAGQIGVYIKKGFVGLFGFAAYVFPFIVIGICLYSIFSSLRNVSVKRVYSGVILFITLSVFAEVMSQAPPLVFEDANAYALHYFSNAGAGNGGLLGAVIGNILVSVFSRVGTYIILFASALVCFIEITGKSFFKSLAGFISFIMNSFSEKEYAEDIYDDDEPVLLEEPVKPETVKQKPLKKRAAVSTIEPPTEQTAALSSGKNTRKNKNVNPQDEKRAAPSSSASAKDKKPSDYTIEITNAEHMPERKLKLITEELSINKEARNKNTANKETAPVININQPNYGANDIGGGISGDINKPSVKLKIERRASAKNQLYDEASEIAAGTGAVADERRQSAEEPEQSAVRWWHKKADSVPDGTSNISENTDVPWETGTDTSQAADSQGKMAGMSHADNSQSGKKAGASEEYVGDILLNNAPVYEEEVEPSPDITPDTHKEYVYPPINLLNINHSDTSQTSKAAILENSKKLEDALRSFKVEAKVIEVSVGPTVTRYELSPGVGVKVSSISNLSDDLALNLAAAGVRIEAPIPGKAAVGIEVPNKEAQPVFLREVAGDPKFINFPSKLAFALGKDIAGNVVVADIARMPHMLIAGSTGSGKSVCINTLVTSIIYKANPDEVKLLMIDPKVVELKVYNGIPHLLIPVVTDPKKAAGALNWAVREMTTRYDLFAETSVRDLKGYNQIRVENGEDIVPQIVIIIDELADLMMTAGKEVEEYICRLAQMARAAGIHLIIATQRPSVDVITGLIKANIPSKIAFAVSSSIDSRTIIGEGGAEKLLGRGDMLFYPMGMNKPLRVQGSFVSDKEVEAVVSFVKSGASVEYDEKIIENINSPDKSMDSVDGDGDNDEFMEDSIKLVVDKGKASASMLQRQFRIGYNRASRLIEILEERGIVGPEDGSKPRKVLMTKYEWEDYNSRRLGL